jgi:hypothetical protein
MEVFGFIAIACVVVGFIVWGQIAAGKRRKELEAMAASWGFSWSKDDPFGIAGRYDHAPLCRGERRFAYNVFDGERGSRRVTCFDYHYVTYTRDSKGHRQTHTHRFSAALVHLDARFPRLLVRPENFLDKVAEFVGADDIDFESAEFSRKFFVKCDDRRLAYDIFHARAMEYMLAHPADLTFDFRGDTVLLADDRTWNPARFADAVGRIEGLLALVPDFVWDNLRGGAGRKEA